MSSHFLETRTIARLITKKAENGRNLILDSKFKYSPSFAAIVVPQGHDAYA